MVARWHSRMVPAEAARFAREVVAGPPRPAKGRAKALLFAASRAGDFALRSGLELRAEVVFCPAVIERFIVGQYPGLFGPHGPHPAHQLPGAGPGPFRPILNRPRSACPANGPKSRTRRREISAYLACAGAQPTECRRQRSAALICLGAGAGLVGAELSAVRGPDVVARSGGLVVEVKGRHPRAVPVLSRYGARLVAAAAFAGPGYLVGGTERSRRNVASGLVASLAGGTDLARLELARLRSTWLAELAGRMGLGAFMAAAGVDCSQRLGDIVAALAPLAEAEAVALLGGRG